MRKRFFRPAFCTLCALVAMCGRSSAGCAGFEGEQEIFAPASAGEAVQLNKASSGTTPDGQEATRYTLTNKNGVTAAISNHGAISTPDNSGEKGDAVLGLDSLGNCISNAPYVGAAVGCCANRIVGGRFILAGETYTLAPEDRPNPLHGGEEGFGKKTANQPYINSQRETETT